VTTAVLKIWGKMPCEKERLANVAIKSVKVLELVVVNAVYGVCGSAANTKHL